MPDSKLIVACAGLVLLACLAVVALLRRGRGAGPMVVQDRPPPPLKGSLEANARGRGINVPLAHEVIEMLEAGRRAEAVALVRERTGWSEREAEKMLAWAEDLKKRLS